jgi:hypothetical protein
MIAIPPPDYRRKYPPVRRVKPKYGPRPSALSLIAVTDIEETAGDLECVLVFDTTAEHPLASVAGADPQKWTMRYDGKKWMGILLTNQAYNTLALYMAEQGPEAGPDVISYAAGPSDIGDTLGRQLGAVVDWPIE